MPKKMGVNSKAEAARERKTATEAERKEKEARDKEDKYWREAEGAKSRAAKKREEESEKKAEAAARKAEAKRLAEIEEKEIEKSLKKVDKKANRVSIPVPKVTEAELVRRREEEEAERVRKAEEEKRRASRIAKEEEYEKMVLVQNRNRDDSVIEARSVEEAIAQMAVSDGLPAYSTKMETQTATRRVETIAAHIFAANYNISVATNIFPLNCSGGLASVKRRCDNSMQFAKQDSESQGCFMRPKSTEQDCFDQSMLTLKSTCYQKEESSELVTTPLFSQPASIYIGLPRVTNIQHDVSDLQPPKFSRTTIERDVLMKVNPMNNKNATKHLGFEKKLSPRMDIAETGGKYVLLIELPGISIDDIRVEVDNTTLTVQTTKGRHTGSSLSDHTNSSYYRKEILEGPFEVKWPLPFDVNPDSISAEFMDGLLHITITKLRVPVW